MNCMYYAAHGPQSFHDFVIMCFPTLKIVLCFTDHSCPPRGGLMQGWESELAWLGGGIPLSGRVPLIENIREIQMLKVI